MVAYLRDTSETSEIMRVSHGYTLAKGVHTRSLLGLTLCGQSPWATTTTTRWESGTELKALRVLKDAKVCSKA